jgi:hypothetical protein
VWCWREEAFRFLFTLLHSSLPTAIDTNTAYESIRTQTEPQRITFHTLSTPAAACNISFPPRRSASILRRLQPSESDLSRSLKQVLILTKIHLDFPRVELILNGRYMRGLIRTMLNKRSTLVGRAQVAGASTFSYLLDCGHVNLGTAHVLESSAEDTSSRQASSVLFSDGVLKKYVLASMFRISTLWFSKEINPALLAVRERATTGQMVSLLDSD